MSPAAAWRVLDGPRFDAPSDPDVVAALEAAGIPGELRDASAALLARRGIVGAEEVARFLDPRDRTLHDPRLLPDAPGLIERLKRAGSEGEPVLVVGDFDADGLTGAAILVRALAALGAAVDAYIPNRASDGHGIPEGALVEAEAGGAALLLTVDCGTADVERVEQARALGISVGIVDHHAVPPRPARADWLLNPNRTDSTYPFPKLAGSGLAFKVAQGLLEEHPRRRELLAELSVLAMVGGIADMVPVADEFRTIVRSALRVVNGGAAPIGIAALLKRAGAEPPHRVDIVGFTLAPRINAAGRLGDARPALELLVTDDPDEAAELADQLEAVNEARKGLGRDAMAEARALLALDGTAFDLARAHLSEGLAAVRGDWSPGVLGLVAGRLAEELGRPVLVAHEAEGAARSSIRAPQGYSVAAALQQVEAYLHRHGGHDGAGGCSFSVASWQEVTLALGERFAAQSAARLPELTIDLEPPAGARSLQALAALVEALAPTGPGNADPVFLLRAVPLRDVRLVGDGRHARIALDLDGRPAEGIAFGRPDAAALAGTSVDLAARIALRTFRGVAKVELQVLDLRPAIVGT